MELDEFRDKLQDRCSSIIRQRGSLHARSGLSIGEDYARVAQIKFLLGLSYEPKPELEPWDKLIYKLVRLTNKLYDGKGKKEDLLEDICDARNYLDLTAAVVMEGYENLL